MTIAAEDPREPTRLESAQAELAAWLDGLSLAGRDVQSIRSTFNELIEAVQAESDARVSAATSVGVLADVAISNNAECAYRNLSTVADALRTGQIESLDLLLQVIDMATEQMAGIARLITSRREVMDLPS